ncbi:hypothetical protein GGG16DRAFT_112789 [Schizophyllum commune]
MGTLSCLSPSSTPFHLPHTRHPQAALDSDTDADELASAVNGLPGSPNATTIGLPNGLVVVKKAVACKCPQYLPRTPNATAYGLFNDYLGIILDLTKLRKCINVLTPSGPNTTAIGLLNDHLQIKLLNLLQLQMPRKSVNAPGSSPNATDTGNSMIPSTTSLGPYDAMQARQCIADSPNGTVIGQRNDLVDV